MEPKRRGILRWLVERAFALAAATAVTLGIFLVPPRDLLVQAVGLADVPPPPPPPPPEEKEDDPPPEQPPKLEEPSPPLDLSQLELALSPNLGSALFGDFSVNLGNRIQQAEAGNDGLESVFSMAELDQRPRVIFQRVPSYPPELRRQERQGTVYVVFLVDKQGRVVDPKVQSSTDAGFDTAALDAVRQWRFEPGTRGGEKVRFKMRVPITFNPK
jgi:protein TonB